MTNWADVPKTEIHLHIEGAAPPEFIRMLAAEKNVDLSRIFRDDGSYVWQDFAEFLNTYEAACSVLQTPDDFRRLTEAVLDVSAANGVIYAEIFLSPDFCGGGDLGAWKEFLAAISEGAENSKTKHGVEDRKSTRLNSSHVVISYAVFCLKKKKITTINFSHPIFNLSSDYGQAHNTSTQLSR